MNPTNESEMEGEEVKKARWESLNKREKAKIIPGFHISVYMGFKIFINLMINSLVRSSASTDRKNDRPVKTTQEYRTSIESDFFLPDNLISTAMYSFSAYRDAFINNYDICDILGNNYITFEENKYKKWNQVNYEELKEVVIGVQEKLKKYQIKKGKLPNVTVKCHTTDWTFGTTTVLSNLVVAMAARGVYLNCSHHVATLSRIGTILSLFHLRMKEMFYQEPGKRKGKNVKKDERDDSSKFGKLSDYGLNYHAIQHLRMLNYPPEIKHKMRNMTGVLTDIVDIIDYYRGDFNLTRLSQFIPMMNRVLRQKMRFWNSTIIDSIISYLEQNCKDPLALEKLMLPLIACLNVHQTTVDFKLVLPAYALTTWDCTYDIDTKAQGAYKLYNQLQTKTFSTTLYHYLPLDETQFKYVICTCFMDSLYTDQRLLSYFFNGIEPMQRYQFSSLKRSTVAKKFTLPQLKAWSKMYRGEVGRGGSEQSTVLQGIAAKVTYDTNDFFVIDWEQVMNVKKQGPSNIVAWLSNDYQELREKHATATITFGTQLLHDVDELNTKGELKTGKEIDLSKSRVVPFFANTLLDRPMPSASKKLRK